MIKGRSAGGAGDTRATERVAASLVHERDLDLDEYPEVEPPFARQVGAHRVSIYPVLPAVLAAPVFALVFGVVLLGEPVTPHLLLALAGVGLGVVLVNRTGPAPAPRVATTSSSSARKP